MWAYRGCYQAILKVPGTFEDERDNVLILIGGTPDIAVVTGNAGARHFTIHGWGSQRDLLINTTDQHEGMVMLASDTFALEITAEGDWSITVEE